MARRRTERIFPDVMLDIETLGTEENSLILSIGLVKFNMQTSEIGESLHLKLDIVDSLENNFELNIDTVKWWLKQPKEFTKLLISEETFKLKEALNKISNFLNPTYKIWAKSPSFDCNLLKSVYKKLNKEIPWDFRKQQDVRTLINLNPDVYKDFKNNNKITHNALQDCFDQIEYCTHIFRTIKIKK